jgi:hypothetical protein
VREEAQGGLGGWAVADLSPGEKKRKRPPKLTDATEIVRYVPLSTLFLYLSDRAFIPSLKCLRGMDKFEGEVGLEIPSNSKIRSFAKNLENEFAKRFGPCPPEPPHPYRANINWRKELAKRRAIWCWNLWEEDSHAMWQLYRSKGVPNREYASMCRFSNSIEDGFGVKTVGLRELDHGRKGLVLEMAGKHCSYELQWENGMMVLGRFYQGRREMLYRGSPSVESEWNRMLDAVRCCEGKMALEAFRMINSRMRIHVESIKKNYAPKLPIQRRLRM